MTSRGFVHQHQRSASQTNSVSASLSSSEQKASRLTKGSGESCGVMPGASVISRTVTGSGTLASGYTVTYL